MPTQSVSVVFIAVNRFCPATAKIVPRCVLLTAGIAVRSLFRPPEPPPASERRTEASILHIESDTNQNRKTMATTKFKDMPVHLSGDFIATGAAAPDFELVKTDLGTLSLSSLKGKRVILNIFPSLDTGVCAMSVRKFNQLAASLPDTVVLAISKDLPFAHARFCTVEGIENLVPLSDFRHSDFDENYGVLMADGPLQGLLARSVVVIDREGKVVYTELVPEITQEPDYDRAVEAAKRA